jgi:hypothetical protein
MRLNNGILWTAFATLAVVRPLVEASGQHNGPVRSNPNVMRAQFVGQSPGDGSARPEDDQETAAGSAASSDRKDTRLTLKDIQRLREQRIAPERIVEKVAEQGRAFDVTAEAAEELRLQGFSPLQIHAIKESSPDPLVPGKWLTTSDKRRNQIFEAVKQIAAKSKVDIKPVQSQHVTLWADGHIQRTYLADIEQLEKFFHTKCAEPIRSGLDKRSAHIILLNNHAEYEAWCRAKFDLFGQKNNPVAAEYNREEPLKQPAYYSSYFVSISLDAEDNSLGQVHHQVAGGVGSMYFSQLAEPRWFGPLQTGFINAAETAVFGSPTVMFHSITYGIETTNPREDSRNWSLLVRQRMATHKATPLGELLEMNISKMLQPHYAEGWTLVELLASQPGKFGKLLLALRKADTQLAAIDKVYGWDEKRLTHEWRTYVMNRGVRAQNRR